MDKSNSGTLRIYIPFGVLVVLTLILRLHSFDEPLSNDQTVYGYISHYLLQGDSLYRDMWEQKPPGIMIFIMVAELIWGYGPPSIKYLDIVFNLASLFFIFLILLRIASPKTAFIGGLFWALASNSLVLQGNELNTESILNTMLFMAIWAYIKHRETHDGLGAKHLLILGLSFAVASATKTIVIFPFLAFALFLALGDLKYLGGSKSLGKLNLKDSVKKLLLFSLPSAVIWILIVAYFSLTGVFEEFFEAVFLYNLTYSDSILANLWKFFSKARAYTLPPLREILILPLFAIGWLVFANGDRRGLTRPFMLLLVASLIVATSSPGHFYAHYFQLLLPPLCIMAALLTFKVGTRLDERKRVILSWGLTFVSVIYLAYFQATFLMKNPEELSMEKYRYKFINSRTMGNYIATITGPCDTVLETGNNNGIYYYSKRKTMTRYLGWGAIVRDRGESKRLKMENFTREFAASPPNVIVTTRKFINKEPYMSRIIGERYAPVSQFDDYLIFKLKGVAPKRTPPDC
jgi:hypothetical protein